LFSDGCGEVAELKEAQTFSLTESTSKKEVYIRKFMIALVVALVASLTLRSILVAAL
jgi:hypothetical protein